MQASHPPKIRFHDLDALRAVAMLLGILLHAALSFTYLPIWPAQDINQNDALFGTFNDIIHGFRMPLFFLVSGFFTAMLAQKRGLRALAKHRTKRVFLPLAIGWFAFSVPVFIIGAIGASVKSQSTTGLAEANTTPGSPTLLAAAVSGDTETARALLDEGADVDMADGEKNQPLHTAAFFGHAEFAELLLEHGADPTAKNIRGDTPIMNAQATWEVTKYLSDLLQLDLDRTTVEKGRAKLLPLLTAAAADNPPPAQPTGDGPPAEINIGKGDLIEASLRGDTSRVRQLLEAGAEPDATDGEGNSAIFVAAFVGNAGVTRLLLEYGADPNNRNAKGDTPLAAAKTPWWLTEMIAGSLMIELDRETVEAGRAELIPMLLEHGAEPSSAGSGSGASGFLAILAFIPFFNHLWFLYYLLWLVAAYVLLTKIFRTVSFIRIPDPLLSAPGCLLWLIPLTLLPQIYMNQGFGPDTATGALPWPPIVAYYAIFFFFGAACFGRTVFHEKTGRLWPLYLGASVPLLLIGIGQVDIGESHLLFSLAAVTYAWLMSFASIGFFRKFFRSENRRLRYISDASYWLYLAHLPLVMLLQIVVAGWDIPAWIKFLGICAVTYGLLIVVYEYAIRYTWAGTLLNGKKTRAPKIPPLPPSPES